MTKINFSYMTIDDVYATAESENSEAIREFARNLERGGVANFGGVEYIYRPSAYGMEVVSMKDFTSEQEDA